MREGLAPSAKPLDVGDLKQALDMERMTRAPGLPAAQAALTYVQQIEKRLSWTRDSTGLDHGFHLVPTSGS